MRSHTTTSISKARRVVLALAVCSLAIPTAASAEPLSSPDFGPADSGYSSVNSLTPAVSSAIDSPGSADVDSGYSSLNAISGAPADAPTFVSSSPSGGTEGFDWPSALVGGGAALALTALGGAALLTVRRRSSVTPSPSTS